MDKKKWIAYGVTGVVGLGVVAGGATAAATSMDLRTQDGTVVPGSAITNGKSVIDGTTVQLRDTGSSISVVTGPSAPSAVSKQSAPSIKSVASAASTPAVSKKSTQASKKSSDTSKKSTVAKKAQNSAPSYSAPSYSAPSYSAPSRPSPASAPSADSPDSVASAWSD